MEEKKRLPLARGPSGASLHFTKYLPETPSTVGLVARKMLVWAPWAGDNKKSLMGYQSFAKSNNV